jgi:uncharacterized protein (TIGR03067 family)
MGIAFGGGWNCASRVPGERATDGKEVIEMTSTRIVLVAAVLIPLSSGCGSSGDDAKLQGEWTVVSADDPFGGRLDDLESVTFSGNEMITATRDGKLVDQFRLDPSSSPKRIDLFPKANDGSFQINDKSVIRGIYELNGDELKICHGVRSKPAPTDMDRPGSFNLTLKRKR